MARAPARIVLATGNAGKVRELAAMMQDFAVEVVPQSRFAVPEAAESGLTFIENAILKARNAGRHTGLPAIADDSGLMVDALGGKPGVHSAYYAGVGAGDAANNDKLLAEMAAVADGERTARFVCVLVFLSQASDPLPMIAEGVWEGTIRRAPAGGNGFGYDPLFQVPGRDCASAELPPADKNRLSHRGRALRALLQRLRESWA